MGSKAVRSKRLSGWVSAAYDGIAARCELVKLARFSLFAVLLGAVIMIVPQGREVSYAIGERTATMVWFFVAVTLLAVHAWFWARRALDHVYPRAAPTRDADDAPPVVPAGPRWRARWVDHLPRVLGASAFLVAVASVWHSVRQNDRSAGPLLLLLALCAVFYALVSARRSIGRMIPYKAGEDMALVKLIIYCLWPVQVAVLTLWSSIAANRMGETLGAGAVLFAVLASAAALGGAITCFFISRRLPAPVVTLALGALVLAALWGKDHAVELDDAPSGKRMSLDEAARLWRDQVPSDPGHPRPLIVVATAGGGIRATQWTVAVLTALEARIPNFSRDLFAISGVSGGGVGGVAYIADLTEELPGCPDVGATTRSCRERRVAAALAADHLAANLAAGLFLEAGGRIDRGRALEMSWERSWSRALGVESSPEHQRGLERRFARLWHDWLDTRCWLPLVMINSTLQETGQRVITSPVDVTDRLNDAEDFLAMVGERDLRLSTAAHNGARFTYISPAGGFVPAGSDRLLHVIDGGYFENFGAQTAREVLDRVWPIVRGGNYNVRPVVIQIVSDPDMPLARSPRPRSGPDGRAPRRMPLNEVWAPVIGFWNTRSAHGSLASEELWHWVQSHTDCEPGDRYGSCGYYVFDMPDGSIKPPLGWLLSRRSEAAIADMLSAKQHAFRIEALCRELTGRAGPCWTTAPAEGVPPAGEAARRCMSRREEASMASLHR